LGDQIEKIEMSRTCSTCRRERSFIQGFGGKYEAKRPLGRPRCRWKCDIKMDIQEIGWRVWTGIFWLRVGTSDRVCENRNEPSGSIKCREFLDWMRNY